MTRIDRLRAKDFDLGGLDTTFGFLLHAAWRDALRTFGDYFEGTGITPLTYSVLLLVQRNPGCAPGDLSDIMGVTANNISRLLDEMVSRGVLERRVGEVDRRVRLLHLTPQGATLIEDLSERHRAYEAAFNERLGSDRIAQLCDILRGFD